MPRENALAEVRQAGASPAPKHEACEEALGLEVEMLNTTAVPVIWEAMSRGKGEVDIWTEA